MRQVYTLRSWVFFTVTIFSITVNHTRDCFTSFFYICKKAPICFFLCVLAHVTRTTVVGETPIQTINLFRDFWIMLYCRLQVISLFSFPRVHILHRCFILAYRSNQLSILIDELGLISTLSLLLRQLDRDMESHAMAKYGQLAVHLTIMLEIGHMWTPKHSHILASAHIIYEFLFQPRGSTTNAYSSMVHMSDPTQDSTPAHVPAASKSMVYQPLVISLIGQSDLD